jgi:nitroreductase
VRPRFLALLIGVLLASCATRADPPRDPAEERAADGEARAPAVEAPAEAERPWVVGPEGRVELVAPNLEGGIPLMQALARRRSTRLFGHGQLSARLLSELLWAAFGQNRDDGHRTAPSAWNRQELDLYLATEAGLLLYDAPSHSLSRLSPRDLRALTGTQEFVAQAPVNLVYVADFSRMRGRDDHERMVAASASAGAIAQNVYLYCASAGLATVLRGSVDADALAPAMSLRAEQRILFAQSVGYPGESSRR